MPILMVTPDDEDVDVEEADFEAAKQNHLEPAFEMVDRDGNVNVVRKKHMPDAERQGMVAKPVWDAMKTKVKGPGPGTAESAARGFANFTSPIADEASGFFNGSMLGGAKAAVGGLFGMNQTDDPDVQKYMAARDQYRQDDDTAWEDNPEAYGAGAVAGIGAGLFGGGAGAAKTALTQGTRAARAGKAALAGARMGAVQAVGGGTDAEGQADLATGDRDALEKQFLGGAGLGALFGAGGEEAADFLRRSAPKIRQMAGERATKATGTMLADQRKIAKRPGGVGAFGQQLLEDGVVSAGASLDDIAERAATKRSEYGKGIGDILGKLDDFADEAAKVPGAATTELPFGMDLDTFANRVRTELIEPMKRTSTGAQDAALIEEELGRMLTHYGDKRFIPFKAANAEKSALDDVIYRGNKALSDDPRLKARQELRGILNSQIENDAEELVQKHMPNFKGEFKNLKKNYGTMTEASRISEDKLSRNNANRILSPSDYGTGIGGAVAGAATMGPAGMALGLVTGAINRIGRDRGPQMTAVGLNKLGKALQSNGAAFSKYAALLASAANKGDESLELAHHLLYKSDPQYRNLVDQGGTP